LKKLVVRAGTRRLVFVSDRLKQELKPLLGIAEEQCIVIPNGVDLSRFDSRSSRPLRAELGLGEGEVLVGAVGNIRAPKSYDVFLRAAALLKERSPRYRFVIVGEHSMPLYEQLLSLRRELGLERECVFTGLRSDIAEVMHSLDVYALSSTTEGFSIACIEAMSAGKPVVATRCGGPQEILEDGRSGLLVPVQDPAALAAAVDKVANDPALAASLGENARTRVLERYTLTGMLAAYQRLITDVAGA
jgi:glycosyltransferase involved in cell wall biosynthesis